MKTTRKHVKSLLVTLLAILVLIGTAQPAFANSVTDEIEKRLVSPQGNEDGTGWEAWNAEYESYGEMWAKYFLDLLPDSSNPEALQLLTKLPEYDNLANENTSDTSWSHLFISNGKDVTIVRDEAFRLAKELGINSPNWSTEQKMARLNEWLGDHYSTTWDGPPYYWGNYKGPLNWNETVDGEVYNCVTQANGIMTLYRIAGIPSITVGMDHNGIPHMEAFYYDGTTWRHPGIRYNGVETFIDYFKIIRGHYVYNVNTGNNDYYIVQELLPDFLILDITESWIDVRAERFIFDLLQTPYAHPEKALTRGEVAKIVCNFLNVVPMRNEQIFSDVPVSHKYSSYIWAMNSLGIMNGVGGGAFNPDGILTMQEFAVIAARIKEYGKQQAIDLAANWRERMLYIDEFTQEELARFDAEYKEKVTLFDPPANSTPKTFKDADKVADWAKPTIDEFSKFGILEGDGNGYLNPTEQLSKTRFLVFMHKFNTYFDMFSYSTRPTPIF